MSKELVFSAPAGNTWTWDRYVQVVIGLIGLILAMPLMAVVAWAIKLQDGGPLIFRQTRLGLDCHPFTIYKFRTMRGLNNDRYAVRTRHDCRLTCVGRQLRRFRLDELPQFWNIIKGEMALIGPRPTSLREAKRGMAVAPDYLDRCSVLPGITGLAQVSMPRPHEPAEIQQKFRLDMEYIDRRSLLMNLWIIVKTVPTVILGRGM